MSAETPGPRRDIVIAATVIVVSVIACVTLAIMEDKPTTAILTIVVPLAFAVLVFFGAKLQAGQQQLQTQVNGNQAAALAANMELARLLAAAQPVAPLSEVVATPAPPPTDTGSPT